MRKYNKIISICLVIMFMFTVLPVNVFAAEASAGSYSVSLSSSKINKGKSTTLKITTSHCAGKFNVTSSNPSVATVSTGSLWVDGTSSITVKGVSKGTATITITPVDVADEKLDDITYSKSVTIKVTETVKTTTKVEEEDNKKETEDTDKTKSSDATLKNITVKNGTLVFDKNKTEYTINVGKDVTSLGLKATANSTKATVKITGDENFKVGENIVKVTVTAEDGTTKVYTITVIKSKYGLGPVLDLKVKGYEINPEFDPAKLEYSVDVTGVTEVELEYTLKDETSTAEVVGNKDLKVGKNEVKLIVTEKDGTVTTYTINVNLVEDMAEKSNTIWLVIIIVLVVLVIAEAAYIIVKNKKENK